MRKKTPKLQCAECKLANDEMLRLEGRNKGDQTPQERIEMYEDSVCRIR